LSPFWNDSRDRWRQLVKMGEFWGQNGDSTKCPGNLRSTKSTKCSTRSLLHSFMSSVSKFVAVPSGLQSLKENTKPVSR
jgi:hypothetical protein